MRSRLLLATAVILAVVSCGGDAGPTVTSAIGATDMSEAAATTAGGEMTTTIGAITTVVAGSEEDPCALATPEQVAAAFGGTSASGAPGLAPRTCTYTVVGGVTPTVDVFHFGASEHWDDVKIGYVENRGGTTEVTGVGEEAYNPNDAGPYELVVRSDDVIFAVAVLSGSGGPEVEAAILELAGEIAGG
jgi:hypothetical protein